MAAAKTAQGNTQSKKAGSGKVRAKKPSSRAKTAPAEKQAKAGSAGTPKRSRTKAASQTQNSSETSPRAAIIEAALTCAAARDWARVSLRDIADEAGCGLGALLRHFASKDDIIRAFLKGIDLELADRYRLDMADSARERLFDILMQRFDLLGPHKPALRRITASLDSDPLAAAAYLRDAVATQHAILTAAGITPDGLTGAARKLGLGAIWGRVYRLWLDDDDPGLARTMAALDRALRRGETLLARADMPLTLGRAMFDFARGWRAARSARGRTTAAPHDNRTDQP